jgi:NAD+--dinitrogen-reductase ADP-D-ribosyltransferase
MQQNPDRVHDSCPETDNDRPLPTLPAHARLPFNRCNLPAVILGSLTFQRYPTQLYLDGVLELHRRLFDRLGLQENAGERALAFQRYMDAHFSLRSPEEAGLDGKKKGRGKADYLRLLRGWLFDPDGRDAAVLKGWVESRFGLITRYHGGTIPDPDHEGYQRFLEARATGLYATNALEAQLDLVYEFCQYELGRTRPGETHVDLYRGVNRLGDHERLAALDRRRHVLLLNNLSSFTTNRERAEEFGDYILRARVPLSKVFFYNRLLPGVLKGEDEFMIIGGLFEVELATV